jgi:hypothetical protein
MTRLLVATAAIAAFATTACNQTPKTAKSTTGPLPRIADVVCRKDGTGIETVAVQPGPDGVRIRIRNETDTRLMVDFDIGKDGSGGGGGVEARPGSTVHLLPFATDQVAVSCDGRSPFGSSDRKTILVVDRAHLVRSPELTCATPDERIGTFVRQRPHGRTPLGAARIELKKRGLRAGDRVEEALGLPEERAFRAVRNGKVLASVRLDKEFGGWTVSWVDACTEFRGR